MLSVLMCELFLLPSSIHSLKSLNKSVSVVLSKLNEGWKEMNFKNLDLYRSIIRNGSMRNCLCFEVYIRDSNQLL